MSRRFRRRTEMTFRNEKFDALRLTDTETGDVTETDRFLFLSTMHHVFSNKERIAATQLSPQFRVCQKHWNQVAPEPRFANASY